jgi:hypothetical protein
MLDQLTKASGSLCVALRENLCASPFRAETQ